MNEFWVSSGHLLLDRSPEGRLLLTDDFLRAFLARPELMPPEEACEEERTLHATLLATPTAPASPDGIADPDAAENWRLFLTFRDHLIASPTLEAAYLSLIRGDLSATPPLFLTQLVHVLLRNALHGCTDAATVRAAELLFRPQRATHHDGALFLADAEAIETHEQARTSSPLLAMLAPPAFAELAVLGAENAQDYWGRSDAFDMVLNLGGAGSNLGNNIGSGLGSGRDAIGRALRLWLRHMLGIDSTIDPLQSITDPDWRWFIGLDSDATRIGNALWHGEDPPEASNLLALYRLVIKDEAAIRADLRGHPIYLMLAKDSENRVRLKPHNLLTLLPLEAVS